MPAPWPPLRAEATPSPLPIRALTTMRLATELCFRLVRPRVIRREAALRAAASRGDPTAAEPGNGVPGAGANLAVFDTRQYTQWRCRQLEDQFRDHFGGVNLAGKAVLDFGCGTGQLCQLAARAGAARVDGIDLREADIAEARRRAEDQDLPVRPNFAVARDEARIEHPDATFDLILCFDAVEHIYQYRTIIAEWHRVLRPGGRILIWWQPYYHPWGHHLEVKIPLPWAHVLFSKRTLSETCDRVYAMPEYRPRVWELDDHGHPLPRDFGVPEHLGGVNGLTIRHFERLCLARGLRIARREAHPFHGPRPVELISGLLAKVPLVNELFTAFMIYELERPD
jgi:2-polyprenyl-3-methyl-5-hydroxy-6-metoxy-1,4-benzoquinol methylase